VSKNVATFNMQGIVIAINVYDDNYELGFNQILVTTPAYVGGDYVNGYFYPPQPYPSWTRNNGKWIPPVAMPATELEENQYYSWNESIINWEIKTR